LAPIFPALSIRQFWAASNQQIAAGRTRRERDRWRFDNGKRLVRMAFDEFSPPHRRERRDADAAIGYGRALDRRFSGASLWWPFSNFRFGVPQTGSMVVSRVMV
jgi:hypothetical protein